ncbi:PREDICTED: agamous-like MADS-box protein AGL82 [Nicotiana attenuata]|uniref:Agamous-like mads-box protein agl82 n=1 Tax=Nicotiana attenuata TaxID=49451 RepID=A0A1J6IH84_NICAT|nr:PREDICTED: agamous-like MADS-box protein AGL82 [Nicotiana attenuata]OIT04246.1 agamous-like mads-box protein agl82 [Nicotiana attenuata]
MGRSKIKMELIQDHKKRNSTFQKRKACLIKKISEISILCDIKACMIISEGNNYEEIWPNDPNEVQELINLYKNQPIEDRNKRENSLCSFLENEKKKAEIKMAKLKTKIKTEKYPTWDSRFNYLSEKELRNLAGVLEKKMENAKEKSEFLKSYRNINQDSNQEIWDYPELMDNFNQSNPQPISYMDNQFFQELTADKVNSMRILDNVDLNVGDYEFGNLDYMKIEAEDWLVNNGIIGSSSRMQPMELNQYSFISSRSTQIPYGYFQ